MTFGLKVLVVLLASSWVNMGLYTFELLLCIHYFRRLSRPAVYKIGVGIMVFFDSVCTLAIALDVCIAVAAPRLTNQRLALAPLATQVFATYVSSVISQLFLTNLLYTLTGTKAGAAALIFLIVFHLGFSWASAFAIYSTGFYGGVAFSFTIVGAISCAVTDIIIATSLAWKFWTMMDRAIPAKSTRSLLRQILILTITSGTLCAGNTLVIMVLLLKDSPAVNFFFLCQGRIYALTLLGNFLVGIPGRTRALSRATLALRHLEFPETGVVFRNPEASAAGTRVEGADECEDGEDQDEDEDSMGRDHKMGNATSNSLDPDERKEPHPHFVVTSPHSHSHPHSKPKPDSQSMSAPHLPLPL